MPGNQQLSVATATKALNSILQTSRFLVQINLSFRNGDREIAKYQYISTQFDLKFDSLHSIVTVELLSLITSTSLQVALMEDHLTL